MIEKVLLCDMCQKEGLFAYAAEQKILNFRNSLEISKKVQKLRIAFVF